MDNPVFMNRKQSGKRLQEKIPGTDIGMRIFWNIDLPYVRTGSEPMYVTEGNTLVYKAPPHRPNEPLKVYFSYNREVYKANDPTPHQTAFRGKLRSAMKGSRARATERECGRADTVNQDTAYNEPIQTFIPKTTTFIPDTKFGKQADASAENKRYMSYSEHKDDKHNRYKQALSGIRTKTLPIHESL